MKKIICVLLTASLCASCGVKQAKQPPSETKNNSGKTHAEQLLKEMTLEEKVWQMFFIAPEDIIDGIDTAIRAGEATKNALSEYPVGGIVYFGKNIETREQISEMIANTQSYSRIPLFISVDEEGGRVARLGNAGIIDTLPPMADIGAMGEEGVKEAEKTGVFLGTELSKLGFNMDFAPVADVITIQENEDIGNRSFGSDPYLTAKMIEAEVKGMQGNGVSAVLKHFPGNGSTETNTHFASAVTTRTPEEMRNCEFIPFKSGIDAGADAVMVSHVAAVNLSGDETPSTMSDIIICDYLRGELGFQGIVITDALNMGAITDIYSPEEAAVTAVSAGTDMLLMSTDVQSAAQAVINSVRSGAIDEGRIDESILRILRIKENRNIL